MIVDRPFLFLIEDKETKSILFMGVVGRPRCMSAGTQPWVSSMRLAVGAGLDVVLLLMLPRLAMSGGDVRDFRMALAYAAVERWRWSVSCR